MLTCTLRKLSSSLLLFLTIMFATIAYAAGGGHQDYPVDPARSILSPKSTSLSVLIAEPHDDTVQKTTQKTVDATTATGTALTINQITTASCPTINATVTVTDTNNTAISNLNLSNFMVRENGTPQIITNVQSVGSTASSAASYGLILDYSGSMSGTPVTDLSTAAKSFISGMGANDYGEIIKFGDTTTVAQAFTNTKSLLTAAITTTASSNYTYMFEAIQKGLTDIAAQPATFRKALVVMTDGQSNTSTSTEASVIADAKLKGIPIFVIGLGSSVNTTTLNNIATSTGGRYFAAATSANLSTIFSQLGAIFANQYIVTYNSNTYTGTSNSLNIQVSNNGTTATDTRTFTPCTVPKYSVVLNQLDAASCPTIKSYVSVSNAQNAAVTGLTASNFSLTEDGVAQTITSVATASASVTSGASVALTMDYSGSMYASDLTAMEAAATSFVNMMGPLDNAEIVKFDTYVSVAQSMTSDKTKLLAGIAKAQAGGTTALYDAIGQAVKDASAVVNGGLKAVIAMTDGGENDSVTYPGGYTDLTCGGSYGYDPALIVKYAVSKGVPVYTIGFGVYAGSEEEKALKCISAKTGGLYFISPKTQADLQSIYQQINHVIQNQYVVTYNSSKLDGKAHSVAANVNINGTSAGTTSSLSYTNAACIVNSLTLTVNQVTQTTCPNMSAYVTVLNGTNSISGLTKSNFILTEAGTPVTITGFNTVSTGSVLSALGFIMDYSGSMSTTSLTDMQNSVKTMVSQLGTSDQAEIIKFGKTAITTQSFSADKTKLNTAVAASYAGDSGSTALYDSIYAGITDIDKQPSTFRKAIVALTDGGDNASTQTISTVAAYAKLKNVPVFTIGLGLTPGSAEETNLKNIATQTGGIYYYAPNSSSLAAIYQSLGNTMQNQYIINYTSNEGDGKTYDLKVDLNYNSTTGTSTKSFTSCAAVVPPVPVCSASSATMYGDVNADGKVDIFDALLTLQYSLNLISHDTANNAKFLPAGDVYPFNLTAGTVTGDGKIDVFDAILILQSSVNLVKLPVLPATTCSGTQAVLKLKTTGTLASGKKIGGWGTTIKLPAAGGVTIKNNSGILDATAFAKSGLTPAAAVFVGSYNAAGSTSAVPYIMLSSLGDISNPTNGSDLGEIATVTFDIIPGAKTPVKADFVVSNTSIASAEAGAPALSGVDIDFDLTIK